MTSIVGKLTELDKRGERAGVMEALNYTPPTAYTPAAIGLTTPVYNNQWGYYARVGKVVICWGQLDINSWAGQAGYIRVTLPVTPAYVAAAASSTIGVMTYFRAAGSTQDGSNAAMFTTADSYLGMTNITAGDMVSWEATSRVVLTWQITYIAG